MILILLFFFYGFLAMTLNGLRSSSLVVLILRRYCRERGSSLHGVEKFISTLKAAKLQSTTCVSLVAVKSLHRSRVYVNRCVCSKCVSNPGSSAK